MAEKRKTYKVSVGGVERDLRLFKVPSGVSIAILNILGDTEFTQACAKLLAKKLSQIEFDTLMTAEAKSIPLAHALSVATKKPYVILRKSYKPYMGETLQAETVSITTGKPQSLFLDEKDRPLLKGKKVIIFDDVISTGSTQEGMRQIVKQAKGKVAAEAAIFTEGENEQWEKIIALGNLPIFTDK
jgi:adenine phosphoribosyltransferase